MHSEFSLITGTGFYLQVNFPSEKQFKFTLWKQRIVQHKNAYQGKMCFYFVKKTPLHYLSPGLNEYPPCVRVFRPPTPARLYFLRPSYHILIIHPSIPPTNTAMLFCKCDWPPWICKDNEDTLPCLCVPIRKRVWLISKTIVDNKMNILNESE